MTLVVADTETITMIADSFTDSGANYTQASCKIAPIDVTVGPAKGQSGLFGIAGSVAMGYEMMLYLTGKRDGPPPTTVRSDFLFLPRGGPGFLWEIFDDAMLVSRFVGIEATGIVKTAFAAALEGIELTQHPLAREDKIELAAEAAVKISQQGSPPILCASLTPEPVFTIDGEPVQCPGLVSGRAPGDLWPGLANYR